MKPGAVCSNVKRIQDILQNLTECQRDDGQIVSGESQNRHADDHAENSSRKSADQESQHDRHPFRHPRPGCVVEKDACKCPCAHECGMSQGKFPEETDNQVQGNCHHDICADRDQQPGCLR